jgi:LysM repeat protein
VTPTQDLSIQQFPTQDLSSAQFPTQDLSSAQFPTQDLSAQQFPTQDLSAFQAPTLDTSFVQPQTDQNIDPIYITATYIVARATQTEAFFLTATAGGPIFTPTPTFDPFVPTATLAPVPGAACTYVVVAGDNLFRISMRYGMTPQELALANGIPNMNLIVVGQQITIPNCGSTGTVATPIPGITPVPGTGTTYTVVQGDTLFNISLKFGVPYSSIAAANGISNINLIVVGQQLTIPPA